MPEIRPVHAWERRLTENGDMLLFGDTWGLPAFAHVPWLS